MSMQIYISAKYVKKTKKQANSAMIWTIITTWNLNESNTNQIQ